jgi:pilus assembly protein Flp/PilA
MTKSFHWFEDVCGATAIEYALIAAGIAMAITVVVFTIGTDLVSIFQAISTTLASALL